MSYSLHIDALGKNCSATQSDPEGNTYTVISDRETLARANLPGREIFGPMNKDERTFFLKTLASLAVMAAKLGKSDLARKIADTMRDLQNNKIEMGPVPFRTAVDGYVAEIGKEVSQQEEILGIKN